MPPILSKSNPGCQYKIVMADKVPPPPPRPPQRPRKAPPAKPPMPPAPPAKPPAPPAKPPAPPAKPPAPPAKPPANPSPPPKPKKEKTKSPPKRKPKPKAKPKGQPGKKKKRKGRKINIKLGLRQKKITDEEDTYSDQIGWTSLEENFEDYEDPTPKEPEIITHQCTMCGVMMRIPRPKRERYKVICAHPECGHADMIGI